MHCTHCGAELPPNASFCPRCGTKVKKITMPETGQGEQQAQSMPTAAGPYNENPETPETGGKKKLAVIIAVVCVAAAAAAFLCFFKPGILHFGSGHDHAEAMASSESELLADSSEETGSEALSAVSTSSESVRSESISASSMSSSSGNQDLKKGDDFESLSSYVGKVKNNSQNGSLRLVSSDTSYYPSVKLYYSYEDAQGEPILLTAPAAGIREKISGGAEIERTVRRVQRLQGNEGLSIDIVADKSSSMEDDLPAMQNVMTQFVNSLDYQNGDTAEIITFDTYIMFMCMNTNDASLLDNGIQNMSTYGDTALYDALITGIQSAGSRSGARCVIGFTDGEDNSSTHTYQEVIALSQQMEVPVYIIGTASADSAILQEITTQTGGQYWSIDVINDMSEIMNEIYGIQKDMDLF